MLQSHTPANTKFVIIVQQNWVGLGLVQLLKAIVAVSKRPKENRRSKTKCIIMVLRLKKQFQIRMCKVIIIIIIIITITKFKEHKFRKQTWKILEPVCASRALKMSSRRYISQFWYTARAS
jgi:hypothetical protein